MSNAAVFVKEPGQALGVTAQLNSLLADGEFITSAVAGTVSPISPSALVVSIGTIPANSQGIPLVLSGGNDNVSYGCNLQVVTSFGRNLNAVIAVLVKLDLNVPFATKNPFAYQSLVGEIAAGDAAIGKGVFILPVDTDVSSSHIQWTLLDSSGSSLSNGNCFEFVITHESFATIVTGTGVVNVPSYTPETMVDEKFQLRWELHTPGKDPVFAFEAISILPVSTVPVGVADSVEMQGDPATLSLVTESLYDTVWIDISSGNSIVASIQVQEKPIRVSTGWYYQQAIDTTHMPASLDPYGVSWRYSNSNVATQVFRETAKLFIVNPSISVAIEDVRMRVSKARTSVLNQPDLLFDTPTIMSWLRRGRDEFNGAGQFWTTFTMLDATGGVREFWLTYSEIAMLRAQALAEGEKAFNFAGQAISLDVDRSQYYQTLADTLQSRVDTDIRPYKVSLKMGNMSGGSGNVNAGPGANLPKLGIMISPISQVGRLGGIRYPY